MIISALPEHAEQLELTPEGTRELAEVYGMSLQEAMRRNLAASTEAWTMLHRGEVLAMFGIAPISVLEGRGELWVVGSASICRHRLVFARQCKRFFASLTSRWSELAGHVENRPDVLRWATWLGVELTPVSGRLSRFQIGGA